MLHACIAYFEGINVQALNSHNLLFSFSYAGSTMSFEDKAIASRVTSPSPKSMVSDSDPSRMMMVSSNGEHSQTNGHANAVIGPVAIFWDIENCPVESPCLVLVIE